MSKRICSLNVLISLFCLNLYATETSAVADAAKVAITWAIGIIVSLIFSTAIILLIIAINIGKQRPENNGISKEFVRELYYTYRHSFERGRQEGIREGEQIKAENREEPA